MVTNREEMLLAFASRLNIALDEMGFPQKERGRQVALGKLMDVTQNGARKWLMGESFPSHPNQVKLAEKLRVRFEWLSAGKEPMREPLPDVRELMELSQTTGELDSPSSSKNSLARVLRKYDHASEVRQHTVDIILDLDEEDVKALYTLIKGKQTTP